MQRGLFLIILMGQLSFFTCDHDHMILITQNFTWEQALNHCRQNYCDLVSITGQGQQNRVQEEAKNASSDFVWLGLRYSCALDLWFWVNDKMVCYDNWYSEDNIQQCYWAAAMTKEGGHKWVKKAETETFNFICTSCTSGSNQP